MVCFARLSQSFAETLGNERLGSETTIFIVGYFSSGKSRHSCNCPCEIYTVNGIESSLALVTIIDGEQCVSHAEVLASTHEQHQQPPWFTVSLICGTNTCSIQSPAQQYIGFTYHLAVTKSICYMRAPGQRLLASCSCAVDGTLH